MATLNTYNHKVLIGNWYEERVFIDHRFKDFQAQRRQGVLLTQQEQTTNATILKAVQLSPSDDEWVHFGDCVMIINNEGSELVALSFSDNSATGAMNPQTSVIRNTFVIRPVDNTAMGEKLCYNQPFAIATHTDMPDEAYLMSDMGGLLNVKKSRTQPLSFCASKNYACVWKTYAFQPQQRMETGGMPVPSNSRVIITHVKTNNNLSIVENSYCSSDMGRERELTAKTEINSHQAEQPGNVWMIVKDTRHSSLS